MNLRDQLIRWWIRRALTANNSLDLIDKIKIEWSNRFKVAYASATFQTMTVKLSVKHWRKCSTDENRDTVMHEICHLIAMRNDSHYEHGEPWKQAMINAGLDPYREIPRIDFGAPNATR